MASLPQRTAGGLPLRGCFLRGRRGIILPAFLRVKRDFFGLLPIGKAVSLSPILANGRTFFPLVLRVKRDFFGLLPIGKAVSLSPILSKWQGIFPVDFAGQAGFPSSLLPIGKAVSLSPILANGGTFFPLILRVKRDFYSAFCPTAGGGFFLWVLSSRQIFPSADFSK